jgi:hypothetical protein
MIKPFYLNFIKLNSNPKIKELPISTRIVKASSINVYIYDQFHREASKVCFDNIYVKTERMTTIIYLKV